MTSSIEQYALLVVRFNSISHPTVIAFVAAHAGEEGFLEQVRILNRLFRVRSTQTRRNATRARNSAIAALIIGQLGFE